MENKKITAVEWLVEQNDQSNTHHTIRIPSEYVEKAKEMEKEQQDLLNECIIQLEYLNQKFGETGTTNALLSKLKNKQTYGKQ